MTIPAARVSSSSSSLARSRAIASPIPGRDWKARHAITIRTPRHATWYADA